MSRCKFFAGAAMVLTLSFVSLTACRSAENPVSENANESSYADFSGNTYNPVSGNANEASYADFSGNTYMEQGIFYLDEHILSFMDSESGLNIVLCDQAGCDHASKDCYAYFSDLVFASEEDGKLLLLISDDSGDISDRFLYAADINGGNRKKLADFGNMQFIFQVRVTDEYIIVAYRNAYDENYEQMDHYHAAVYVYDRAKGTGRDIWVKDAWDASISQVGFYDGYLYFNLYYSELTMEEAMKADEEEIERAAHTELVRISVDGENEMVLCNSLDETSVIEFCGNTLFYLADESLMGYDTQTGESKRIGDAMYPVQTCLENETVFRQYDKKLKKSVYYLYHADTGEIMEIGSCQDLMVDICYSGYTYATYYGLPSGTGIKVYYNTKEFLAGNLDSFTAYRASDGSDRYSMEKLDFVYDPSKEVEIEGEVDSPEEAFAIVLEAFEGDPIQIQNLITIYSVEEDVKMYCFKFETDTSYYTYVVTQNIVSTCLEIYK